MSFQFPRNVLPPEKTFAEKLADHLEAKRQYQVFRAAYVDRRRKEDEAYRRFRAYGHNNNAAPPEEGGSAPEPAGE